MIRQSVVRSARSVASNHRLFSISVRSMAEGDIAAPGSGAQGDAFSRREQASENKYVREQELAKLKALKEKLEAQRKNIGELIDNIEDMSGDGKGKK